MVIKLNTRSQSHCYIADHVLNNTCWYHPGVQGLLKEESLQSLSLSKTWMDPISIKGEHAKYYGDP